MRIGVDFGGTKIEAAALDASDAMIASRRIANPGAYDPALVAVRDLVAAVEREAGGQGTLGVGAPGSVSPRTGLMRNANSTWLNGRAFGDDLAAALTRPVRLANDADCLALSEAADGAAAGAKLAFAVILGTGCGGGLAVNGRLIEGASGIVGEWGHTPLPWPTAAEFPGPTCWCGRRGCLETWISGSGLARDHGEITGQTASAEAIVAGAAGGNADAAASLDRFFDRLARGLAVICDILDPDVIVVGGGLSNIASIYEAAPKRIAQHVFTDVWEGRLAPARWGDSSGVRGAARLWEANGTEGLAT